jgi:hypothetical protein
VVEPSSAPWSGLNSVMVRPARSSCRAETVSQRMASSKVKPALCSGTSATARSKTSTTSCSAPG